MKYYNRNVEFLTSFQSIKREIFMLYIIIAIISGAMISAQSSYNGMLYPFIGVLGVGFISQLLNAFFSLLIELIATKKFPKPNGMPFHACFGGVCAIFVLGFSGYLVAHLGSAVTVCLSVSGQLIMSAVVDHFGFFGSEKVAFHANRLPGFLCILAGVFVINFVGADSFTSVPNKGLLFLLLLFAIGIGCITVFAKMFNFEASHYVGKIAGSFYNAGFGAIIAFFLFLAASGFRIPAEGFLIAPKIAYLTGPLGAFACVLNNMAYSKIKVFHATIFLLIGQIGASIVADLILLGNFPMGKLLGIAVVCLGIFLDKRAAVRK